MYTHMYNIGMVSTYIYLCILNTKYIKVLLKIQNNFVSSYYTKEFVSYVHCVHIFKIKKSINSKNNPFI